MSSSRSRSKNEGSWENRLGALTSTFSATLTLANTHIRRGKCFSPKKSNSIKYVEEEEAAAAESLEKSGGRARERKRDGERAIKHFHIFHRHK